MSSLPAISVLLPIFQAEPYLEDSLGSIADQSFADFEVIGVDDGSIDGSGDIFTRLADRDRRFRLIRQEHQGLIPALNTGLQHCRGELVARMDADDISAPKRLEMQYAVLEGSPELDIVSCLVSHFPDDAIGEGFRIYEQWLNGARTHDEIMRERFIESPIAHPSVMLRRSALQEIGGYRDLGFPEDYDLWLRLAAVGKRFGKVAEKLYLWRHHEERLTRTDSRYAVERFLACKAHHLAEGPLRGVSSVVLWGAGQTGRRLSKHLLRHDLSICAVIDIDLAKIGRTLRGVPIHAVEDLPVLLEKNESSVVVTAVSSRGARTLIRQHLEGLGLVETRDFWCAA